MAALHAMVAFASLMALVSVLAVRDDASTFLVTLNAHEQRRDLATDAANRVVVASFNLEGGGNQWTEEGREQKAKLLAFLGKLNKDGVHVRGAELGSRKEMLIPDVLFFQESFPFPVPGYTKVAQCSGEQYWWEDQDGLLEKGKTPVSVSLPSIGKELSGTFVESSMEHSKIVFQLDGDDVEKLADTENLLSCNGGRCEIMATDSQTQGCSLNWKGLAPAARKLTCVAITEADVPWKGSGPNPLQGMGMYAYGGQPPAPPADVLLRLSNAVWVRDSSFARKIQTIKGVSGGAEGVSFEDDSVQFTFPSQLGSEAANVAPKYGEEGLKELDVSEEEITRKISPRCAAVARVMIDGENVLTLGSVHLSGGYMDDKAIRFQIANGLASGKSPDELDAVTLVKQQEMRALWEHANRRAIQDTSGAVIIAGDANAFEPTSTAAFGTEGGARPGAQQQYVHYVLDNEFERLLTAAEPTPVADGQPMEKALNDARTCWLRFESIGDLDGHRVAADNAQEPNVHSTFHKGIVDHFFTSARPFRSLVLSGVGLKTVSPGHHAKELTDHNMVVGIWDAAGAETMADQFVSVRDRIRMIQENERFYEAEAAAANVNEIWDPGQH